MLTATVSQVKNGLSAYLRRVKAGETVLIVERKTPVARIVPLTDRTSTSPMSSHSDRARIERLVAEGVAVRGRDEGALSALHRLGGPGRPAMGSSAPCSTNEGASTRRDTVEMLGHI